VRCPTCGVRPVGWHRYDAATGFHERGVACKCPARRALARKVSGILRAHFTVAERPCNGEAHSNPFIDHCMVCTPRWGTVEYLTPGEVLS
jgi:hypothetical protein